MLARHVGRWFKSGTGDEDVEVGAVYRHVTEGKVVETAKVIEIGPDLMGIPHVHYTLLIKRARLESLEESRTLGLQSFTERFSKAVLA